MNLNTFLNEVRKPKMSKLIKKNNSLFHLEVAIFGQDQVELDKMFHASRSSKWISEGQARYDMTLKRMPSLPVAGNHIKGALFQGPTPLNVIKPNLPSVCPSLRSVKPVSPPSHPRHRLGSAGECSLPLKQPSECNSLPKNCTFKSVPQKPLVSK